MLVELLNDVTLTIIPLWIRWGWIWLASVHILKVTKYRLYPTNLSDLIFWSLWNSIVFVSLCMEHSSVAFALCSQTTVVTVTFLFLSSSPRPASNLDEKYLFLPALQLTKGSGIWKNLKKAKQRKKKKSPKYGALSLYGYIRLFSGLICFFHLSCLEWKLIVHKNVIHYISNCSG